jgi:hypothetical protein
MTLRRVRWFGNVARMGAKRNAWQLSVGEHEVYELDRDGSIFENGSTKNGVWGRGTDSVGSGQGPVAGCCDHGDERACSVTRAGDLWVSVEPQAPRTAPQRAATHSGATKHWVGDTGPGFFLKHRATQRKWHHKTASSATRLHPRVAWRNRTAGLCVSSLVTWRRRYQDGWDGCSM